MQKSREPAYVFLSDTLLPAVNPIEPKSLSKYSEDASQFNIPCGKRWCNIAPEILASRHITVLSAMGGMLLTG